MVFFLIFLTLTFGSKLHSQQLTIPDFIAGLRYYNPEKSCNGYTILTLNTAYVGQSKYKTLLIDMDGQVVQKWPIRGQPIKVLPGGSVIGWDGYHLAGGQISAIEARKLVQLDWSGKNVEWEFSEWDKIKNDNKTYEWEARQHHDWQRQGNPVGYYAPGQEPLTYGGTTFVLAHKDVKFPQLTKKMLLDDAIYEVDENGKLIDPSEGGFRWFASEHYNEFGFDKDAEDGIKNFCSLIALCDWLHINSMSFVGPNKWYNEGDERFNPDNIIIDSRNASFTAIIDRKTGNIVWKIGPDYSKNKPEHKLGKIIGQHHAHIIPAGLPGEGNVLLFDNGGFASYGKIANLPFAPKGMPKDLRAYSRIIEFNPKTLDIVWKYHDNNGLTIPLSGENHRFFSILISSAQRLPNGNTLITEGITGRIFEVTKDKEITWEYIVPYSAMTLNSTYRAYRVPPKWLTDRSGEMLMDMNGKKLVNYYQNTPLDDSWK
jgi:hypothetical protein